MSVTKRVQLENKKSVVDGFTYYEYVYEVTNPNGTKVKKTIRQKVSSSKVPRFVEDEHHETVLESINKYINEHEIAVENLHENKKLVEVLKPIQAYIIETNYIRVNLPVLKNFIKKEILLMEN